MSLLLFNGLILFTVLCLCLYLIFVTVPIVYFLFPQFSGVEYNKQKLTILLQIICLRYQNLCIKDFFTYAKKMSINSNRFGYAFNKQFMYGTCDILSLSKKKKC